MALFSPCDRLHFALSVSGIISSFVYVLMLIIDNIAAKRFNMDVPGSGRICIANLHVDYDFIIVHSIVIGSDYTTIVTLIEAEIRGSGQGCQFQYSILVYVR